MAGRWRTAGSSPRYLLKVPPLEAALGFLNDMVLMLQNATEAGSAFVFGYLGGGPLPFEEPNPARASCSPFAPCR